MVMVCNSSNCCEGVNPFKYLRLSVWANPKKISTSEPLLGSLSRKLNSWRNNYVIHGGRIVLNLVLNSTPIFYLSFLKLLMKVGKRIVRIVFFFFWVKGGRMISWMNWKSVWQPHNKGGLGVRDVKLVNLSLLAKWWYRLIQSENLLWKEVLSARYGPRIGGIFLLERGDMA